MTMSASIDHFAPLPSPLNPVTGAMSSRHAPMETTISGRR
jgi:hypothetical protein